MTLKQARDMAGTTTWASHSREHVDTALAVVVRALDGAEVELAAERIENTRLREAFVTMEKAANERETEVAILRVAVQQAEARATMRLDESDYLRQRHAEAVAENVQLKRQAADAYDYLEHEFDTVDGEDGTPQPNWAMTVANILDPERWRR